MEPTSGALTQFIRELKTRRVTRVAVTYVAVAFAGLQGLELVLTPLGAERAYRWIVIATLTGFPVALALAWFIDLRRAGTFQVSRAAEPTPGEARRRWSRRRVGAIAAILMVGVGLLGYRMLAARPTVSPAAEVIAVAPFSAVGGEASALGEGMAQLLAVNLDQVGGLRTLDPTRVLRAWSEGSSRRSDEEALALGRKLGAGSVLIGSAVAVGGEVRLSSVLRAVNGREIARAQVTGRAADVLLLADSLSNRLLRAIWRSRSPIPQLRIAAITTSNLDAIRAYLDGERYYRQLRWDSAIASLRRAVELDSSFALAHRRLADAYGWRGEGALRLIAGENVAAARTPERLPERERAVALAAALWHDKRDFRGALDSLASHLRRYPDDAEALYLRAEILLHGGPAAGAAFKGRDSLLAAFEDALRADPELTPAMIHPINLSLRLGDSVRFRRYLTHVLRAELPDTARVPPLVDSAIGLYWQRDTGAARLARRIVTDPALRQLAWESPPIIILIFSRRDPNPAANAMRAVDPEALDTLTLTGTALGLIAVGRISEAERFFRALDRRSPLQAQRLRLTAVAFGIAGRGFLPRSWPALPPGTDPAFAAPAQALIDLSLGDTAAAARELASAGSASGRLPPAAEQLRRFEAGRLRALRGDLAGGVKEMEQTLRALESLPPIPGGPPPYFHRVFLAEAYAEYAPTRKQGIEWLRRLEVGVPLVPLVRIYLARALEADGQREAAKQEYVVFLRQTGRAEGPLAKLHAEAQVALARLTRER